MAERSGEKPLPLLNTAISEMPVNDLPIDSLTRGLVAERAAGKQAAKQPPRKTRD